MVVVVIIVVVVVVVVVTSGGGGGGIKRISKYFWPRRDLHNIYRT